MAMACPGGFFVSKNYNLLFMIGGLNWLVGLAPAREPTLNFEEDF